jgi:hypothetical protein
MFHVQPHMHVSTCGSFFLFDCHWKHYFIEYDRIHFMNYCMGLYKVLGNLWEIFLHEFNLLEFSACAMLTFLVIIGCLKWQGQHWSYKIKYSFQGWFFLWLTCSKCILFSGTNILQQCVKTNDMYIHPI